MGKSERERARRELQHALDALSDGAGQELWGPGMLHPQLARRSHLAATAFRLSYRAACSLGQYEPAASIAAMRKLAPVMLEILLGEEEP